ncbi:MAG TPA: hypothetical protein VEL51_02050 [Vicinamibacterales bacterium]|nr:hypothetical protein [Vicinamibacterales bacterium]
MCTAVLLGLVLAQVASGGASDSIDLQRIRKALAESAPVLDVSAPHPAEGPVFRVTILGRKTQPPLWANWPSSSVPSYVRPSMPLYHFEFLQRVTPEPFRSSTLYPGTIGVPVMPLFDALVKWRKAANRRAQERDAREEVRQALEELLACRADPARPGC